MTITNENYYLQYAGDGSQVEFAYNWRIYSSDDLVVTLRRSTGVEETQTIGTHYSVSGVGAETGGLVIMVTAPAAAVGDTPAEKLNVRLKPALLQNTGYTDLSQFPASSHEQAVDRTVNLCKSLQEQVDRCPQFPVTGNIRDVTMPMADGFIRYNAGVLEAVNTVVVNQADSGLLMPDPADGLAGINQKIAEAGGQERLMVLIPGTWEFTDDYEFPANITVIVFRGAELEVAAGKILFIRSFDAGLYQVFYGDGNVRLGSGREVYPQWFGWKADWSYLTMTGTDNTPAGQKAVNCIYLSNQPNQEGGPSLFMVPPGYSLIDGAGIGIGTSAQAGLGVNLSYFPGMFIGMGRAQTYGGGSSLVRSDGGFAFVIGGEVELVSGLYTNWVYTANGSEPGPVTFGDFTISYAGDRNDFAAIAAGWPCGIGGCLHYAEISRVNFTFLYRGIDTRFDYPYQGDAALSDHAKLSSCNFNYIAHRGASLNEADGTVLSACRFHAPTGFVADTDLGPGNLDPVSACGLAVYGGSPVLVGGSYNGYGGNNDDYAIYTYAPYTLSAHGVRNESRRFLYANDIPRPDVTNPANMGAVLNFHGGSIFNQLQYGINIHASAKVNFFGTTFQLLEWDDDHDIFYVDGGKLVLKNCKFRRPGDPVGPPPEEAYVDFTPVVDWQHTPALITDGGSAKVVFTSSDLVVAAGTVEMLSFPYFVNRGLMYSIRVEETGGLVTGLYDIGLYSKNTCGGAGAPALTDADKLFIYTNIDPVADSRVFQDDLGGSRLEDEDKTGMLHVKISNQDATQTGTYVVTVTCEQFD